MRFTAIFCVLLTGCATITKGRNSPIDVRSRPDGTTATIRCAGDITAQGLTPVRLLIPRPAKDCSLTVEKAGFVSRTVAIGRDTSGGYWGNLALLAPLVLSALVWGLIGAHPEDNPETWAVSFALGAGGVAGMFIDRSTGARYAHDPDDLNVTLDPQARP